MDVKSWCMSFPDSSHAYSSANSHGRKSIFWKFCRITCTIQTNDNAPAPSWVMHPARITSLHTQLTELTPVMVQELRKQKDMTKDSITRTLDDRIVTTWKQRGVCPWPAGDQSSVPSCQNWTEKEQPVTPQQKNSRMRMPPDSHVAYIQY